MITDAEMDTKRATIDPKSYLAGAGAAALLSLAIVLPVQVWRTFDLPLTNWGPFLPAWTGLISIVLGLLLGIKVSSQLVRRDCVIGFTIPLLIGGGLAMGAYFLVGSL